MNDTSTELKAFLETKIPNEGNFIERCEYCLNLFSTKINPNHQFLMDVQTQLSLMHGHSPPYAPMSAIMRPELERKIQSADHVVNVMAKVDPVYTN